MREAICVSPFEFFCNPLTEGNLFTGDLTNHIAIGFYDISQKGMAVLPVDEIESTKATSLVNLVLAQAPDSKILLTGMPLIHSPDISLLQEIQRMLRPYSLFIEAQAQCGNTPIYTKNLVLTSRGAKIIPRDKHGLYDPKNIILIQYNQVQ